MKYYRTYHSKFSGYCVWQAESAEEAQQLEEESGDEVSHVSETVEL